MPSFENLANTLFGSKRAETNSVLHDGETHTIIGTATGDSADGSVMVELSSDVTNPEELTIGDETYFSDASTSVELPTTEAVKEGDEVLVSIYGGTPLRSPVVTGVVGSGDRVAADAEAAREIAEATGQHFWDADDGAHVTEVTREEWEDSTSPNYHSGPNSIWNSLGMLFRNGLNNLLALIPSEGEGYTETFTPSSYTYYVTLTRAPDIVTSLTVDGEEMTDFAVWGNEVHFNFYVSAGKTIVVNYRIGGSSMTFFDGLGNLAENIVASFGVKGATIGYTRAGHVDITPNGIDLKNGEHPIVSFGEFTKFFNDRGDESMRINQDGIDFSQSEYASFVTFNSHAGISSDLVTVQGVEQAAMDINADSLSLSWSVPSWGNAEFPMRTVAKAFEDVTGQITLSGADNGTNVKEAHRRGYTCSTSVLYFRLTSALASGSNVVIGTVPSGYRPSATMFTAPFCNDATFGGRVFVGIEAGGAIRLYNHSGSQLPTTVRMSATWTYVVA